MKNKKVAGARDSHSPTGDGCSSSRIQNTLGAGCSHRSYHFVDVNKMIDSAAESLLISLIADHFPETGKMVEFRDIWKQLNNPDSNYGEFATIRSQAGLNSFVLIAKRWIEATQATQGMNQIRTQFHTFQYVH